MGKIPIALQLYTVRDDLAENPIQTIRSVSEMGYQGVEGWSPSRNEQHRFSRIAD